MAFSLSCRIFLIGALLASFCFADTSGVQGEASPNGLPASERESTLFARPDDYFRNGSSHETRTVAVAGSLANIWRDQQHIWTSPFRLRTRDLEWLVPLGAATSLLIGTDHHTMTSIHGNAQNENRSSMISNAGLAILAGADALSFGIGAVTHNEHARETGILAAEAITDSFFVSEALKLVSQRDRPNISGANGLWEQGASLNSSFPSQHAALAWSAATVFAQEYPHPVAQWAAYGLASLVSVSRITANQHFPSDVLIGAATGYLIGRYVYHAHHHDRIIRDHTGGVTETGKKDLEAARTVLESKQAKPPVGSVYVPLDSWIYPALRRLAVLGYIRSQVSDLAPWTRAECRRQVEEAASLTSRQETNRSFNQEALRLISDLQTELNPESESDNIIRLESVYTRFTGIAGAPLRDSYHFGQTVANDLGRPYGEGLNNVTGFSSYAVSGRFSAYVRGEYQFAPGSPDYSPAVHQFFSGVDGHPWQPLPSMAAANRFQPLEMYAGMQLGFENITFGKQTLWWGPGEESAFAFSNNAEPFYMLRFAQTRPIVLPGPFRLLGKIRTDIVLGKLSGHQWPARPYVNAQKISLDLTDNLEFGFTRSAFFGGVGRPLTFGALKASLLGFSSVDFGPYGSPDLPGDRHSDFDFRWRVPGLRRYVTIYSDSYADDEPNPLDNPKRSAWGPGLYLTHLPGLSPLDFRFETYATWLYRKDEGGHFLYWNNQYRDSYTNQGNLLGSWIGRDARAYTAQTTYWFSAKSKITGNYRQIKAAPKFLPGGGTQTDLSVTAQRAFGSEWLLSAQVQGERYDVPLLGAPRYDCLTAISLTFNPVSIALRR